MTDILRVIACELQERKQGTVVINRNRIEINTITTATIIVLRGNDLYVFIEDDSGRSVHDNEPHIIPLAHPDALDQLYKLLPTTPVFDSRTE